MNVTVRQFFTWLIITGSLLLLGKYVFVWVNFLENLIFVCISLADLGGGRAGRTPPPMGPNSFVFAYIFTEKCPYQRSMPLLTSARPPYGKSWIRHCISYIFFIHIYAPLIIWKTPSARQIPINPM